ncbi:MAG: ATP-dependent 6-phosphofructokinase [Kiritimatiellae bacterium]|nr:ATP-dependent 6-phosphofructokinase [Kiritimatiellia bacterium]
MSANQPPEKSMDIEHLGPARFPSPLHRFIPNHSRIPLDIEGRSDRASENRVTFERAGARERLYFDARQVRAGIVTCGGLCPGLNNVIRSVYMQLHHGYGVAEVLGFRCGYRGLDPERGSEPIRLTSDFVNDIHKHGGTVLGTSRGPVDTGVAVDYLARLGVNMLFCVGGDGTQRGALDLYEYARARGIELAVVGIPKTIDNDVAYVARTFGHQTAMEIARTVIDAAHTECKSVDYGISLVKLMGRHAGFIAAGATIASQDVNFTLIPESPFALNGPRGFLAALKSRMVQRRHAVIVVAEGAGQNLLPAEGDVDASGNRKLQDIGPFLCDRIAEYFKAEKLPVTLRYIDPSYIVRSHPADAEDAILCDLYARNAVHAAMAGKTGVLIGFLHEAFIHVPIPALRGHTRRVDPDGELWHAVVAATGQPLRLE